MTPTLTPDTIDLGGPPDPYLEVHGPAAGDDAIELGTPPAPATYEDVLASLRLRAAVRAEREKVAAERAERLRDESHRLAESLAARLSELNGTPVRPEGRQAGGVVTKLSVRGVVPPCVTVAVEHWYTLARFVVRPHGGGVAIFQEVPAGNGSPLTAEAAALVAALAVDGAFDEGGEPEAPF